MKAKKQPLVLEILVTTVYNRMKDTGVLDWNIMTWEDNSEVENSFTAIKEFFKVAWKNYRNNQKITNEAGHHSANAAITEEPVETIASLAAQTQLESKATDARNSKLEE